MMDNCTMLAYIYFLAIVSVISVSVCGQYCNDFVQAIQLCQVNSVSGSLFVYLDTAGVPRLEAVSCMCTLSIYNDAINRILVTPIHPDPGNISLFINQVPINMARDTETSVDYAHTMNITFVKTTTSTTPQCFKLGVYPERQRTIFGIFCSHQSVTSTPINPPTSISTTSVTSTPQMPHTPVPSTQKSVTGTTVTRTTDNSGITNSQDTSYMEKKKDSTPSLVVVYAVVPVVTVLLVGLLVGVLLWRRRKQSRSRSTNPPEYVNTMNINEITTHNAESIPQYENEVEGNVNSHEHNYSSLGSPREKSTGEHLYTGLESGRDLTNTNNEDSITDDQNESNRHVYGNDYSMLEPKQEQASNEHPYSDLQPRPDLKNNTYANTDSAYENPQMETITGNK